MKHRLTEETAANRYTIQSACQFPLLPRFHRMRVTNRMQVLVTRHDLLIDPGLVTSGARLNHFRECAVDSNFKGFSCPGASGDRKSTRLNSSHRTISYA